MKNEANNVAAHQPAAQAKDGVYTGIERVYQAQAAFVVEEKDGDSPTAEVCPLVEVQILPDEDGSSTQPSAAAAAAASISDYASSAAEKLSRLRVVKNWTYQIRVTVPPGVQRGQIFYMLLGDEVLGAVKCPFFARPGWTIPVRLCHHWDKEKVDSIKSQIELVRTVATLKDGSSFIHVAIPLGVHPGEYFQVNAEGRTLFVKCPKDATPGKSVCVRVPLQLGPDAKQPTTAPRKDADSSSIVRVLLSPQVKPGDKFQFIAFNRVFTLTCPTHCKPGDFVAVKVPFTIQRQSQHDNTTEEEPTPVSAPLGAPAMISGDSTWIRVSIPPKGITVGERCKLVVGNRLFGITFREQGQAGKTKYLPLPFSLKQEDCQSLYTRLVPFSSIPKAHAVHGGSWGDATQRYRVVVPYDLPQSAKFPVRLADDDDDKIQREVLVKAPPAGAQSGQILNFLVRQQQVAVAIPIFDD